MYCKDYAYYASGCPHGFTITATSNFLRPAQLGAAQMGHGQIEAQKKPAEWRAGLRTKKGELALPFLLTCRSSG